MTDGLCNVALPFKPMKQMLLSARWPTNEQSTALNITNGAINTPSIRGPPGSLLLADVYMTVNQESSTPGERFPGFQLLYCNMSLRMQVFETSGKNGVFVEKPIDFIANKWTQVYKAYKNPSPWYYSLNVGIDSDEKEIQMLTLGIRRHRTFMAVLTLRGLSFLGPLPLLHLFHKT
jgi:hypothetical protein